MSQKCFIYGCDCFCKTGDACPYATSPNQHEAVKVDLTPHAGGSLNTTPQMGFTQRVPAPPQLSLEDDVPLQGGFCDPNDKGCESCQ